MIGKNRKSIASIGKLPQFTIMNVIDGQAGLAIYASLIFYSLTIDNILNIIVLLILAGISISMIAGNNGILNKAIEAKEITEEAERNEENILNSYEDIINDYVGIDWDTVLANAEMHPDQKTSTAIGVGTDGRAVNMDLWEYTKLDDGTYALNDSESVAPTGTRTSGYTGNIIDGNIEGTIPQYIKDETDGSFIEVTSIQWLFYRNTELITSPKFPDTITNMYNTFNGCKNLITVREIPHNVTNMQGAFNGCTNLMEVKNLPEKLENLSYTFYNCTSLETASKIPNSVTNMINTFYGCTNLQGEITINANLTGNIVDVENNVKDYQGVLWNACKTEGITLKVVGTCPVLQKIVSETNNPNITLET